MTFVPTEPQRRAFLAYLRDHGRLWDGSRCSDCGVPVVECAAFWLPGLVPSAEGPHIKQRPLCADCVSRGWARLLSKVVQPVVAMVVRA